MAIPDENELNLLGRIIALEHLVKHAFLNWIIDKVDRDDGDNEDAIEEAKNFKQSVTQSLAAASFEHLDPALSDHIAAIVRECGERVLQELVQEMEEQLGDKS
jgi:proline dehydrogenase